MLFASFSPLKRLKLLKVYWEIYMTSKEWAWEQIDIFVNHGGFFNECLSWEMSRLFEFAEKHEQN